MVVLVDDNEVVPRVAADGGGLAELARQLALRPELGVVCPVRVEKLYAVVRSVSHHDLSVLRKKKNHQHLLHKIRQRYGHISPNPLVTSTPS